MRSRRQVKKAGQEGSELSRTHNNDPETKHHPQCNPVGLSECKAGPACQVCIFVISGLTLKTDEVKKALRAWPDGLYGVIAG